MTHTYFEDTRIGQALGFDGYNQYRLLRNRVRSAHPTVRVFADVQRRVVSVKFETWGAELPMELLSGVDCKTVRTPTGRTRYHFPIV